ncbi:MAG TPA: DUF2079 domain-containing protein [Polyangiaceae bacterium]|nr:DUF2079 domain-containing protein [Polyangiaceae bacterium]
MGGLKDDEAAGDSKETTPFKESPPDASKDPAPPVAGAVSETPAKARPHEPVAPGPAPSSSPTSADENEDETDDEDEGDEQDGEDGESAASDDAEPPQPPAIGETGAEPAPLFDQHPWAIATRVVAISSLLGLAISGWAQLSIKSSWVPDFLISNTLGAAPRKQMMILLVLGLTVGAAAGAGLLGYLRKKQRETELERWLWFLVPGLLLPAIPALFRAKPWQNRHEALLAIVLLLSLMLEALLLLSLRSVPSKAREFWRQTVEQVPLVVRRRGPLVLVIATALGYAVFFSFFLLRWHYKLRTGNFDLSINNNLMFGGLHGDFLQSPVAFPTDPGKYLAAHAKFGHYLFLPIYALVPRPETLLIIQSILIGAGSIPLFLFARRHLSEWTALAVALCYLAYYPMHGASFSEFQNIPIAALFVFFVVWAADSKRWVWMAVLTAIALLMREDVPVGLSIVGLFLLASGYRPTAGLVLTTVSTSYFLLMRFYVMEEAGDWWFPTMYKELWSDGERGFRSVIKTLITNPLFVITKLAIEKKVIYLLHLLVPLAFLPLRRWYLWLSLLPGGLLTLLVTNYDPPTQFSFHYVMHWAPYLFMASVLALVAIGKSPDLGPLRQRAALLTLCGATAVLSFNYGAFAMRENSFKGGFNKIEFTVSQAEKQRYERLKDLIKPIGPDDTVAATEKIGPHLSSRRILHTMRTGPRGTTWIVASSRELKLSKTKASLKAVLDKGEYGLVRRSGDFALLKRGHSTEANAKLMKDWGLSTAEPAARPKPEKPEKQPEKPAEDESGPQPESGQ